MMKILLKLFFLSILMLSCAEAVAIDVTKVPLSLLERSSVYYDQETLSFEEIKHKPFMAMHQSYINRSFDAKTTVWVQLDFTNSSEEEVDRVLEIDNPRLEYITMYDGKRVETRGLLAVDKLEGHIYPAYSLHFQPHEQRVIWLKVKNSTTALQFELMLKSPREYHQDDHIRQNSIVFFLGMISAFLLLSVVLYFYLKDNSYLFYAFYLLTLLFQQMTYVGLLPLLVPQWFTDIDNVIAVPKVSIMIIAAAWYAMHFLKTERYPKIHRAYLCIIVILFILMPIIGTPYFYVPEIPVLIGFFFILFNTFTGIYSYKKGYKPARFFIAGWLVLVVAYLVMIADTLGIINGIHKVPGLLLWATTLESMLLLLAFIDHFSILQREKERLHDDFVLEYNLRQNIIENEVREKTSALFNMAEQKELLFKELHHRVKNNLQLILSLLRLQADKRECGEGNDILHQLEGRVLAIARTHQLLSYTSDTVEIIDMQEYVEDYIEEIENTLDDKEIVFHCNIEAKLPLKEATYVGLVINELVTNAIKYAFDEQGGNIYINLKKVDGKFQFEISDDGRGYNSNEVSDISLGLTLVKSLIEEQLEGTIAYKKSKGTQYVMRFGL